MWFVMQVSLEGTCFGRVITDNRFRNAKVDTEGYLGLPTPSKAELKHPAGSCGPDLT